MDIYAFMDAYGLWFALALFVATLAYSAWHGWRDGKPGIDNPPSS